MEKVRSDITNIKKKIREQRNEVETLKKRVETATTQFDLDKAKILLDSANNKLAADNSLLAATTAELTATNNKDIELLKKEERLERASQTGKLFKNNLTSDLQETLKRERELPGEVSDETRKRRLSLSQTLVSSIGSDFYFSDREASFEILASSLEQRFYCHKVNLTDKMLHKLLFLADGPGSGKSRFLQELPHSFVKNLKQSVYDRSNCGVAPEKVVSYLENTPTPFDDFKNTLSGALFINVSFGGYTAYRESEIELEIEVSLSLRILYPYYAHRYATFAFFFSAYTNKHISLPNLRLEDTLGTVNTENQCIVLGIDEVNVLHHFSKERLGTCFYSLAL